jgi:hypothetical protein
VKCDGTRAETRFRLSAQRVSPFKSAGASVHSTTGSRGVHISGSNDVHTIFRVLLPTPFATFPFTSPPVRHRVPSHFNWTPLLYSNSRAQRVYLFLKKSPLHIWAYSCKPWASNPFMAKGQIRYCGRFAGLTRINNDKWTTLPNELCDFRSIYFQLHIWPRPD